MYVYLHTHTHTHARSHAQCNFFGFVCDNALRNQSLVTVFVAVCHHSFWVLAICVESVDVQVGGIQKTFGVGVFKILSFLFASTLGEGGALVLIYFGLTWAAVNLKI